MSTDNITGTLSSTGNLNGTFGTSGGGGTSNYNDLENKPQINGNTLEGNKTTEQLGINIPDMSNYYNKTETDTLLDGKADTSDLPDMSNYYNKSETDTLLDGKADTSDLPDMSNYYNKSETDTLLNGKVNNSSFNAASMPITSGSATNTKDYIDTNCLTVTSPSGVTRNTTNTSSGTYNVSKCGKLVILNIVEIVSSVVYGGNELLLSGLPIPSVSSGLILSNNGDQKAYRFRITSSGELRAWYNTPGVPSGASLYGFIAYFEA